MYLFGVLRLSKNEKKIEKKIEKKMKKKTESDFM
jgi:hypothetical protein